MNASSIFFGLWGWVGLGSLCWAQPGTQAWHHADPGSGIMGVSSNQASDYLSERKSRTVVVALIGTGVDIHHPDLEGQFWVNEGEIPGNGLDDDGNGYVDDIHGWNFLGNAEGENLCYETLEVTRLYRVYAQRFSGIQDIDITASEQPDYAYYRKINAEYGKKLELAQEELAQLENIYKNYHSSLHILRQHLGKGDFTLEEVQAINPPDEVVDMARDYYLELYASGFNAQNFESLVAEATKKLDYHLNPRFDPRQEIIGDNPEKWNDGTYGNPDVTDDGPQIGTHSAGIIAALKDNGLGVDGLAADVRLMVLRAVPDGDARDKDIARAILYAVNHGAHIINLGVNKGYSPQKIWIDEALRLAEQRGLLIVQGAGDEGKNLDEYPQFPSPYLNGFSSPLKNWLTVGASSQAAGINLAAPLSNYSPKQVDLFAPGQEVYATLPGGRYGLKSGTAVACAVTSGVAALLWACFPQLTAEELRAVLMGSAYSSPKWKVYLPGQEDGKNRNKTRFWKLSASGGILNALEAARLAEARSAQK